MWRLLNNPIVDVQSLLSFGKRARMPRFVRFALKQSSKSNENNEHHHRRCLICILGIQQICFQLDPFFFLSIHIEKGQNDQKSSVCVCVFPHYPLDGFCFFLSLIFSLAFIYLLARCHYVHVPDDQKLMFSGRNKKERISCDSTTPLWHHVLCYLSTVIVKRLEIRDEEHFWRCC